MITQFLYDSLVLLISSVFLILTCNYKYLQESLELQFGTYTGEVQDGKPHGKGSVSFNSEDIQVIRLIYSFKKIYVLTRLT